MNPGSDEARKAGCTCPVMDNCHGKGYMGGVKDEDGNTIFVISMNCPIHNNPCPICNPPKEFTEYERYAPCYAHQIALDMIWGWHAVTDRPIEEAAREVLTDYSEDQINAANEWWTN